MNSPEPQVSKIERLAQTLQRRKRAAQQQASLRRPFTLLELLVVVAILAIIGGGLIAAYDGLEENASQGAATRDLAGLDQTVRTFKVVTKALPSNLESLIAVTPTTFAHDPAQADTVATVVTPGSAVTVAHCPSKVSGKFTVTTLSNTQLTNLKAAGITKLRYIDLKGNDETVDTLDIFAADGTAATNVGTLSTIDIPQHTFEAPRPGAGRNRGRGFSFDISGVTAGANVPVALWNAGAGGYDNVKVGGNVTSALVVLGIGNASTLIGKGSNVALTKAPFYTNTKKNEYNHYLMLVDVNQSPAKLVAVVDTFGDFCDEEYAEFTDQKK